MGTTKTPSTPKKGPKIGVRRLRLSDFQDLIKSMKEAYTQWEGGYWKEHHIQKLIELFPEGQLCVTVDGRVVGSALTLIVDYDKFGDEHTYQSITGNYAFDTHDPEGDVLYGIDIFVHPEYRGLRLGRRLYEARKELCEKLNLRSIMAGGRLPGYQKMARKLSPRQYIDKVKNKEVFDPTLSFQLSNDFHVRKVLQGYMPGDTESQEFATLLEWNNIFYSRKKRLPKTSSRLGLVQWQMRSTRDLDEFYEQVEFYVDVVSGYQCDFLLFPELFNAPLMAEFNHLNEAEAIRGLAGYTMAIKDKMQELALSYNVNIITGSMPLMQDGRLHNVGFLCRRDGTQERYEKIHVTPNERQYWGILGGNEIRTFETDAGRIGILICYDVEFPELPRLLAEEGMELLFVPFLTDTQAGYMRVRRCAQARAIENECYVAVAGAVGNLPRVHNMDIQYGQAAVFTPSDFPFPVNGVKAEATPNTDMTLIVDVDRMALKELHHRGSVRNLKDRRTDLYELKRK